MQRIVLASAVLGLIGCTAGLAAGVLQGSLTGGWRGDGLRGNDPERMCAGATPGRARHACLAAHGVDDSAPTSEDDRRHARENAEARATTARLDRELADSGPCLATTRAASDSAGLPPHLDRALVAEGMATVDAQVRACHGSSAASGQVLVEVTVAARGCVVAVAIDATPDPNLGACVATALHRATFAPTETGGAFHYPYKF